MPAFMEEVSVAFKTLIMGPVRLECDGIARLLADHSMIHVLGTATSWTSARDAIARLRPDVVLLDGRSHEFRSYVSALRQICDAQIIAFGTGEVEADVLACASLGFNAFCEETGTVDDLVATIVQSRRGELRISPTAAALLFRRAARAPVDQDSEHQAPLTEREADILSLIRQGSSNKEIARRLGLRVATVKNHVHRLLTKLGVHRRTEAIV